MTRAAPRLKKAGAVRTPERQVISELRGELIATCRSLTRLGLTHGTSGNASVRCGRGQMLISPSGMDYETLAAEDIALVDFGGRWFGRRRPSSEWRFHRDILEQRADVGAVVHTHSKNATSLACTGQGIPAFHYMVAAAGGTDIRCAPYRTFGSQELSDVALVALRDRKACLLANHGVIALGSDLRAALSLAGEVENLASQYRAALTLGGVRLLDEIEMRRVLEKFRTYGRSDAPEPDLVFGGAAADDGEDA